MINRNLNPKEVIRLISRLLIQVSIVLWLISSAVLFFMLDLGPLPVEGTLLSVAIMTGFCVDVAIAVVLAGIFIYWALTDD